MPPEKETAGSPSRWLEFANADMMVAKLPIPEGALYEPFCFHAQQAAEKAIKAVLVYKGINFPRIHNIQGLIDLLPPEIQRDSVLRMATHLNPYAVASRYPGEEPPVEKEEYDEAVNIASSVISWAENLIKNDMAL